MIIQGSNEPIVLEFDTTMDSIQKLSAVLYKKSSSLATSEIKDLKKWTLDDDATVSGKKITLNLTESETMAFPFGEATLEIKWLSNDSVWFAEKVTVSVKSWHDTTKLTNE